MSESGLAVAVQPRELPDVVVESFPAAGAQPSVLGRALVYSSSRVTPAIGRHAQHNRHCHQSLIMREIATGGRARLGRTFVPATGGRTNATTQTSMHLKLLTLLPPTSRRSAGTPVTLPIHVAPSATPYFFILPAVHANSSTPTLPSRP